MTGSGSDLLPERGGNPLQSPQCHIPKMALIDKYPVTAAAYSISYSIPHMYSTVSDSALHTSIMIGSTMIRTYTYYTPHLPPLVVGEGLVGDEMDGLHDLHRSRSTTRGFPAH